MPLPMNPASVVFPEWSGDKATNRDRRHLSLDIIRIRSSAFVRAKNGEAEPRPRPKRRGWQPAADREPEPPVKIIAA